MQSSVVCSQDSFRQIDETIVGSADRLGLAISTNFSGEQREKALRIWSPILKRLKPILAHLNRLEVQGTPNGLIATGYAGWSLAICCNEDESMPHYIGIRDRYSEDAGALRALLTDNGYVVEADGETDPVFDSVLRAIVEGLGGTRLEPSSPEPHREPSKRRSTQSRKTTVAKIVKVRHL
jgi:hypothetical protein